VGEPFPDEGALWTALRTYLLAASGAEKVYRSMENAPEQRATSGCSLRFWAPAGFVHPSSWRHGSRTKQKQRWVYRVLEAQVGQVYTATLLGADHPYEAQVGDGIAEIRAGLQAAIGGVVATAPIGADQLQVEALVAGQHLAAAASPADLLTVTQTRKAGVDTRWSPCELVVELEATVDVPASAPDSVKASMYYIDKAAAGFHEPAGPYSALRAAGLSFLRYASQPLNLSGLDRTLMRSRARIDVVFSVDAGARSEFDHVAEFETPDSGVDPP